MKKQMYSLHRLNLALVLMTLIGISSTAEADLIDFNDPSSLLAIPGRNSGAPDPRVSFYREDGMTFTDGVRPPDPALSAIRLGHFHLNFEDATIGTCFGFQEGKFKPGRLLPPDTPGGQPKCELVDPEQQHRSLSPHSPGATIQMIYDPDNNYNPATGEGADSFNLISLEVHRGKLNVGTKSATGRICVYNNLIGGFTWGLTGDCATNLTRATLEVPVDFGGEGIFVVDNIVFEPSSSRLRATTITLARDETIIIGEANENTLDTVLHDARDSVLREHIDLAAPILAALDIKEARVKLRGIGKDILKVRGSLELGAESDGIELLNELVIVTFGGFREAILGSLFTCANHDNEEIKCEFEGASGGITKMRITIAEHKLRVQVKADGLDLSGINLDNSVPFSLQIGDDLGVMHIHPKNVSSSNEALQPTP